jgi:hypothetical protein
VYYQESAVFNSVFSVLSLPWDWSSANFGEVLHTGCSSIAAWIFIFGVFNNVNSKSSRY